MDMNHVYGYPFSTTDRIVKELKDKERQSNPIVSENSELLNTYTMTSFPWKTLSNFSKNLYPESSGQWEKHLLKRFKKLL